MYGRTTLIPFYLVVDVSQSMDGPRLDTANLILRRIGEALAHDPVAAARVRVGVIDFAGGSRTVLPLCDLLDTATLPRLACRDDGTRYAPAFNLLRATVDRDRRQLEADGFAVGRPGVFFLSDGEPFDDPPGAWEAAFAALLRECQSTPNVIPCAVADSNPEIMRALAHPAPTVPLFIQSRSASPESAIKNLTEIIVRSVVASGHQEMVVIDETDVHALDTVIVDPPESWIDPDSRY
ncbi:MULTISPECIES: VWA domain-containing protein [unclassified Frankia]|uniref:vWA domain-containing protein n=1 Tax=unclassified Frankia TaxID=2632575 RepID=UPI001EF6FA8F|nr:MULTISPECIES: VWA domain-containing protein [unclassified Frankia]